MPQKSNKTNIIITIVTIIIILGGVFILNQAISNSSKEDENDTVLETPVEEPSTIEENPTEENPEQDPTEETPSEEPVEENPNIDEEMTEEEKLLEEKKLEEEKKAEEEKEKKEKEEETDLQEGQIAIKVIEVSPVTESGLTPYKLQIVDSTFPDSKFFKKGDTINRIQLRGVNMQQGKTYKVAINFTETGSTFSINSLSILGEV